MIFKNEMLVGRFLKITLPNEYNNDGNNNDEDDDNDDNDEVLFKHLKLWKDLFLLIYAW